MKQFCYTIKDELGIHARPAGLLVKEVGKFTSAVTISKEDKTANAKRIFDLMSLAVKCGETITVTVDGEDEGTAAAALEEFISATL